MSRQIIKSCARHSYRDYKMKNFIITTVMALLIGAFAFTANAQERKVGRAKANTEKQIKPEGKRRNLKNNVNENSTKASKNTKTLKIKKDADAKSNAEAKKQVVQETNDLLDEFVKTVDSCGLEYKKKHNEKNQFRQYLEKALRLSTKIDTKKLTDKQKGIFEESKIKLNGFLKG